MPRLGLLACVDCFGWPSVGTRCLLSTSPTIYCLSLYWSRAGILAFLDHRRAQSCADVGSSRIDMLGPRRTLIILVRSHVGPDLGDLARMLFKISCL
jgi:hypothetical protein